MSDTTSVMCAFPECDRPVAPPPATGGRSCYCDDPEYNATTAFRARRAPGRTGPESGDRPASVAGATLRETVGRLGQMLTEFQSLSQQAIEHLQVATNPDQVQAELAAVRAEALQAVAAAQGELAAEQQARLTADEAAEAASSEAQAARQLAEAAEARAREAQDQLAEATAAHAAELERIRADAQARIDQAQASADEAIRRSSEAETQVRAANDARDQALTQAAKLTSAPPRLRHARRTRARRPRGPGRAPRGSSSSCAPTRPASGTSCGPRWNPAPRCSRSHAASCAPGPSAPSATSTPPGPSWPACASKRRGWPLLAQAGTGRARGQTGPAQPGKDSWAGPPGGGYIKLAARWLTGEIDSSPGAPRPRKGAPLPGAGCGASPRQALRILGDVDRGTRIVVDHGTPRVVARVEPGDPEGFPGREQLGVLELEVLRRHGRRGGRHGRYSGHGEPPSKAGHLVPGRGPGRDCRAGGLTSHGTGLAGSRTRPAPPGPPGRPRRPGGGVPGGRRTSGGRGR